MEISEVLRKTRLLRGFTLEYVADYLGVSTEAYRRKEIGRNDPQFGTLVKLADLYEISVIELIAFDTNAILTKRKS